jgi:hypothetical protein
MNELAEYFRSQAEWRWTKAEEYPEDKRNEQSAKALESLAAFVDSDGVNVQTLAYLESNLSEKFSLGGEQTQREVSRYGYGYPVTEGSHIDFLEELAQFCLQDAYEFATEHGEDWTETLFEFELEAARYDVVLPPHYFRNRAKSTESESEEAVRAYREEQAAREGDEG